MLSILYNMYKSIIKIFKTTLMHSNLEIYPYFILFFIDRSFSLGTSTLGHKGTKKRFKTFISKYI